MPDEMATRSDGDAVAQAAPKWAIIAVSILVAPVGLIWSIRVLRRLWHLPATKLVKAARDWASAALVIAGVTTIALIAVPVSSALRGNGAVTARELSQSIEEQGRFTLPDGTALDVSSASCVDTAVERRFSCLIEFGDGSRQTTSVDVGKDGRWVTAN